MTNKRLFPPRRKERALDKRRKTSTERAQLVRCPLCSRFIPAEGAFLHIEGSTCIRKATPASPVSVDKDEFHLCRKYNATEGACTVWSSSKECECEEENSCFWARVPLRGSFGNPGRTVIFHCPTKSSEHDTESASAVCDLGDPPHDCASRRLTPSVLKSALQKNVRRGRAGPAVRVAIALLRRTTLVELVRRLQIIAIEDAMLCPTFPTLAWLTAALSRGYEPLAADLQLVFETVELLCAVQIRDVGAFESRGIAVETASRTPLEPDLESLVQSLRIRAAYGGMKGDVAMLLSAAVVWEERFRSDPCLWRRRISSAFAEAREQLSASLAMKVLAPPSKLLKGDIPPAALDFHCCSVSEELARKSSELGSESAVYRRFGSDCKDGVERLMWLYSSSVTSKKTHWPDEETQPEESSEGGYDRLIWETELLPQARRWWRSYLARAGL